MRFVSAIGRIALLLAALGLPLAAIAQTTLTLTQAVTTALEKNPARKAAVFEKNAAAADIKLARSALFPQIKFTEAYERGNDPVFVFGGRLRQQRFTASDFALNRLNTPTPFGNFATRFSGGWQLFDSGVSWLQLRQARRMDDVAQRKLQRGDQELVMRVVNAYAGLLLAVKQQRVAEDALKTSQSILDRSRAHVQAGMVVESDLLSAQVNHAARQEELILARNAVALARAQLNIEMGISPDTQFEPADLAGREAAPGCHPRRTGKTRTGAASRPASRQSPADDSGRRRPRGQSVIRSAPERHRGLATRQPALCRRRRQQLDGRL